MWVEIKSDIFEIGYDIDELRKLIQDLLYNSKYYIFIDINKIPEEIFEHFSDANNNLIGENFSKFINDSPQISYFVTNMNQSSNCFSTKDAIDYFNLQFLILLENSDNDGYFLDSLLREFKRSSKRINQFKKNLWLRYVNCGGSGNLKHTINAELKNVGNNPKFLRCFVLLDSDLEYPTQVSKREEIILFLDSLKIPFHILEKREIENYLPIDIFNEINPTNNFIQQYVKLESVQKDFADIEKGLKKSRSKLHIDNIEIYNLFNNPYTGESQMDKKFSDLRNGIESLFLNFKNEYVKLFEHATSEGLLERTKDQNNPNELKLILDKIAKQL